jgi:hypothetical protein
MPGDDVLMMPSAHPIEVYTGKSPWRRWRRWSAATKARMVFFVGRGTRGASRFTEDADFFTAALSASFFGICARGN